jgi:hypothetical protein
MKSDRVDWRRALRPDRWRLQSLTTACVVGAAVVFAHLLKALGDLRPDVVDFAIFRRAAREWLAGSPLYDPSHAVVNYLPPHVEVVFLPLARVPIALSFIVWTGLMAAAAATTVRMAIQETSALSAHSTRLLLAVILLSAGTGAAVHLGQVSWIVALVLTLAWRAARHGRWGRAGAWLGLAIASKPFLLLFLPALIVRRRWQCVIVTGLTSVAVIAAGAAVFGRSSVGEWLALLRSGAPPAQLRYFINASVLAVAARANLSIGVGVGLSAAVAGISIAAIRHVPEDEAWMITIAGALLASPLGWIYYLPLLTAPMLVVAASHRLPARTWFVWPFLAIPPVSRDWFQGEPAAALTAGSVYAWGLTFVWICAVQAALVANLPANKDLSCGGTLSQGKAAHL